MKKAKINKTTPKKNKKQTNNSEFSIKSIIIVILSMLVTLTGFYFLTEKLLEKREKEIKNQEVVDVRTMNDINYSDVEDIVADSYYLLLNKENDENNENYDLFINSLKYNNFNYEFYYIDMSKEANKKIYGEEEKLTDIDEIMVKDSTLIFIEDDKIKDTYVGGDKILEHLMSFFEFETTQEATKDSSNSDSSEKTDSVNDKNEE